MSFCRGGAAKIFAVAGLLVMLSPAGAFARAPVRSEVPPPWWSLLFQVGLQRLRPWLPEKPSPAPAPQRKVDPGMSIDPWGQPHYGSSTPPQGGG